MCMSQLCLSPDLQSLMIELGSIGFVVPLLFGFDETQEDPEASSLPPPFGSDDISMGAVLHVLNMDDANMQKRKNYHAMLSVHVLGRQFI